MKKLDTYLFRKAQSFSDWCQKNAKITNFDLARICVVVSWCLFIWFATALGTYAIKGSIGFSIPFTYLYIFATIIEKNVAAKNDLRNFYKGKALLLLGLVLFVCIASIAAIIQTQNVMYFKVLIALVFLIAIFYFVSCTPKTA